MKWSEFISDRPVQLRDRWATGVFWNLFGAITSQGSVFLANVVIANLLGTSRFGEFSIIQSTALTLGGIAQVATGNTATKFIAEFRSTDKGKAGRVLGLCSALTAATGCLGAFVLLVGAPWLADRSLAAPQLAGDLQLASAFVLFSVINGYQLGALAGLESYKAAATAGIGQGLIHIGICIVATWKWGLAGAVSGQALSAVSRWALFHLALRRESGKQGIRLRYRSIFEEKRIISGFALPAALTGISALPALWIGNTFLVRQPGGYSQMGLYGAANTLRLAVLFVPVLLNNVSISLFNNQRGIGNAGGYRRIFWINLAIVSASTCFGAAIVSVFGRILLGIFGAKFQDAYPILLILMLSTILEGVGTAANQIIQSNSKMWMSFWVTALPRDIIFVVLSYILTANSGAIGLSLAYLISYSLASVLKIVIAYSLGLSISDPKSLHAVLGQSVE